MARVLHNKYSKEILTQRLLDDTRERKVFSFYKYAPIDNTTVFRDQLYASLDSFGCLGRIYIATEGINAQMSAPSEEIERLQQYLDSLPGFAPIRLNFAVEHQQDAFLKLIVRIRPQIVADGLSEEDIDFSNRGVHLEPQEFNEMADKEDTILIDMRNHYESEVGHFEDAYTPEVVTFRESLPIILQKIEDNADKNILMYCTGGIRCEKASAYFKSNGLDNVYQLKGGIINYTKAVKEEGIENKFVGKNFVFDERLGERITEDVIAECHQCGAPCDVHTNCANDACHLLFIQCEACAKKYHGCCSNKCKTFKALPVESRREKRKHLTFNGSTFSKARYSALSGKKLDVS